MSLPAVSVVVPAYNAEATIEACVESLLALDYPADRVELVVVDNASTDGTAGRLRRFGSRLRVVHEPVRGPAAARNAGLRAARHERLAMTDADCVVDRQWLRALMAPLGDDGVALVGGRILALPPCSDIEAFGEVVHDHAAAITRFVPPYVITMNWASRRTVLERHGYFDESFLRGEDVELSYRLGAAGLRFAYAPDAVTYHRNERTLGGLWREGFGHAFHGMHVAARHHEWLASLGCAPSVLPRLQGAARAWRAWPGGDTRARCEASFAMGKAFGAAAGALRFRAARR